MGWTGCVYSVQGCCIDAVVPFEWWNGRGFCSFTRDLRWEAHLSRDCSVRVSLCHGTVASEFRGETSTISVSPPTTTSNMNRFPSSDQRVSRRYLVSKYVLTTANLTIKAVCEAKSLPARLLRYVTNVLTPAETKPNGQKTNLGDHFSSRFL
jgi:hypothetical protein